MKTMNVSIIGFGVVGQGVARAIQRSNDYFKKNGVDLKVVAIVDLWGSLIDESGLDLKNVLIQAKQKKLKGENRNSLEVICEVDHDCVVEVTPSNIKTGGVGLEHMIKALENKRHLVTSNKGPLALEYKKLVDLAKKNDVEFKYEATVGGAMPIINFAKNCLAGNEILSIRGIFNGTCNYILTRMAEDGLPYDNVITEAQELGLAETDPTYDVDGIDTAAKLVILANSIFDMDAVYNDASVTGIRDITVESLKLAHGEGYVVKLIGEVKEGVLEVAPRLVPKGHPLALGGTLNAASIQTDLAGEITVTGKGAGSIEAASAIISDLAEISKKTDL